MKIGQPLLMQVALAEPQLVTLLCVSVPDSFKLFFRSKLLEKNCSCTNAKGLLVYKTSWKVIDASEFDKFWGTVILVGTYKSKNENVA